MKKKKDLQFQFKKKSNEPHIVFFILLQALDEMCTDGKQLKANTDTLIT